MLLFIIRNLCRVAERRSNTLLAVRVLHQPASNPFLYYQ
jgi:hypothetical protein